MEKEEKFDLRTMKQKFYDWWVWKLFSGVFFDWGWVWMNLWGFWGISCVIWGDLSDLGELMDIWVNFKDFYIFAIF
jgi:hypothetical protein